MEGDNDDGFETMSEEDISDDEENAMKDWLPLIKIDIQTYR